MNSDILTRDNLNLIAMGFGLYFVIGNNAVSWNLVYSYEQNCYVDNSNNQDIKLGSNVAPKALVWIAKDFGGSA